jgi:N-acetylneuraminate synthase
MLASGAADIADVVRAVDTIAATNRRLVLMQCNTNYTASAENYNHINLRVLQTYRLMFPDVVLGLSDHTAGHATVLGAVALGARVIEKHFTDDTNRPGPDHRFSMTPDSWRDMVARTRELEAALGDAVKRVAPNEAETVIVQRRCLRAAKDLKAGTTLTADTVEALRPAPPGAIQPYDLDAVLGRAVRQDVRRGEALYAWMLGPA